MLAISCGSRATACSKRTRDMVRACLRPLPGHLPLVVHRRVGDIGSPPTRCQLCAVDFGVAGCRSGIPGIRGFSGAERSDATKGSGHTLAVGAEHAKPEITRCLLDAGVDPQSIDVGHIATFDPGRSNKAVKTGREASNIGGAKAGLGFDQHSHVFAFGGRRPPKHVDLAVHRDRLRDAVYGPTAAFEHGHDDRRSVGFNRPADNLGPPAHLFAKGLLASLEGLLASLEGLLAPLEGLLASLEGLLAPLECCHYLSELPDVPAVIGHELGELQDLLAQQHGAQLSPKTRVSLELPDDSKRVHCKDRTGV